MRVTCSSFFSSAPTKPTHQNTPRIIANVKVMIWYIRHLLSIECGTGLPCFCSLLYTDAGTEKLLTPPEWEAENEALHREAQVVSLSGGK
jgi:hypothetical protein